MATKGFDAKFGDEKLSVNILRFRNLETMQAKLLDCALGGTNVPATGRNVGSNSTPEYLQPATLTVKPTPGFMKPNKRREDEKLLLETGSSYQLFAFHFHLLLLKLLDVPIRHPNCVGVILVLEYVEADTLASQIHLLRKLTERELWCPMMQMADAFEYLHFRNIVHRDIKTDHVLYSKEGIVKVIDFIVAVPFRHGEILYDHCGTRDYMAPEITEYGYEGPPVDVWALGVLFTKLFVGLHFDGRNIIETSHDKTDFIVGNSSPTFARETLVSLLTAMLRKDPMERFTMTEVVNHTWFKENHQDQVESLWNAEPKVTNESVEEESPTGFSPEWNESLSWLLPCTQEAKGRVKHSGSSLSHGEDDERTSSDEHRVLPEFDVGHVGKTFNYLFPVIARF
uniref:5'-AMP-activated protein kinase catalytic subunit alpha-1-like n=1 Tax=Myxine glutinosa TaxID=7769 RepID=UPI00358EF57C